jgi:hypothetical protein
VNLSTYNILHARFVNIFHLSIFAKETNYSRLIFEKRCSPDVIGILGYRLGIAEDLYHIVAMEKLAQTQPEQALALMQTRGIMRLTEFIEQASVLQPSRDWNRKD